MIVLVPTDFSPLAVNAAKFAAHMLQGHHDAQLVLFHMYANESDAADATASLRNLKDHLLDESIVKIEMAMVKGNDLIDCLEHKVRHLGANLVVMAVNEKSKLEQAIGSSHSLRLIERNLCPVMVVPFEVQYQSIKNVALACDFRHVVDTIPVEPVKKILNVFQPSLHIVNVNSEIYISLTEEYLQQRKDMLQMFQEFNPEFYFITTFDFHETLRQFIADKNIDLVLTFPRKHSLLNNLFKGNNTKKLVYESAVPVLAAHE